MRSRPRSTAPGSSSVHPVVSALSVRFLRPAADARIDAATRELLARWQHLEQRLGIDIDLRIFARLDARHDAFDRASGLVAPHEDAAAWRGAQIASLLWPRGVAAPGPRALRPKPVRNPACAGRRAAACPLPPSMPRIAVTHVDDLLGASGPLSRDGRPI